MPPAAGADDGRFRAARVPNAGSDEMRDRDRQWATPGAIEMSLVRCLVDYCKPQLVDDKLPGLISVDPDVVLPKHGIFHKMLPIHTLVARLVAKDCLFAP